MDGFWLMVVIFIATMGVVSAVGHAAIWLLESKRNETRRSNVLSTIESKEPMVTAIEAAERLVDE